MADKTKTPEPEPIPDEDSEAEEGLEAPTSNDVGEQTLTQADIAEAESKEA